MTILFPPFTWPAVIIGLLLGVYWLKVLQLVVKLKKANFVPPELLGRLLRIVWIPAVVLWIFVPMLTPFVAGLPWVLTPLAYPGGEIVAWTAVAVAVVAFAITWVCWIKMGTSWRMGIDPNERTTLVCTGPFAYSRNPIYGLSQLLMITALVAMPSPLMVVIAIIHLVFMQWEVRREEKYLLALHGAPYADYMQRVGRFLPRVGTWKTSR